MTRTVRRAIALSLSLAWATAHANGTPDGMEARAQGCVTCHGPHGEGLPDRGFPRIAGKPAGYLLHQLQNFRDGQRSYPPMNYLLAYLQDDYLAEFANYFAAQTIKPQLTDGPSAAAPGAASSGPAGTGAAVSRAAAPGASESGPGAQLVLHGDAARGIPACVACHGARLTGMQPGIPGLVSLSSRYIAGQLVAWRVGMRHAVSPDCMHEIATRLSEADIGEASAWLAAQPTREPAAAAPAGSWNTAIACGSEPWNGEPATGKNPTSDAATGDALTGKNPAAPVDGGHAMTAEQSRGGYLARVGDCVACHSKHDGVPFAGGFAMPTPFGTLYSPNITPDDATGIGTWSAEDFYQMLHTGRSRDGALLYPAMPFPAYTKITRADSDSLFAYLRSRKPVRQVNRDNELRFPYNNRSLMFGWRALYFSEGTFVPVAGRSAEFNRGAYLVEGLGHCASCHSTINALGGSSEDSAFAGGLIPLQNWYAPSLTSNQESGLGFWSVQDIAALLKGGVSSRGAVYGPMAEVTHNSLQYLTDSDVSDMALYLKSLAQSKNPAAEPATAGVTPDTLAAGKSVYQSRCATCHRADGKGMAPAYPPLAGNPSIEMPSSVNPLRMVLNGGYPPQTAEDPRPYGMPPFAQVLSDDDVAAVVTYIRMSWGNHGSAVTGREANAMRVAPLLD